VEFVEDFPARAFKAHSGQDFGSVLRQESMTMKERGKRKRKRERERGKRERERKKRDIHTLTIKYT
jgi:hypothetical protein